jgi:hypothetical protein
MAIRAWRRRRQSKRQPPTEPASIGFRRDGLAEQLRMMRGNITTPMPAGVGGAQRTDQIVVLARAARDDRWVERTNEDDVLRNITEYRSIDEPRRHRH